MHKKSIEAAEKLKEEESPEKEGTKEREEIRSESIAQLRAKAQEHSAKMREALGVTDLNAGTLKPEMTSRMMSDHNSLRTHTPVTLSLGDCLPNTS